MTDRPGPAQDRAIWAAVPYKGPIGSKRRLASLLNEDERARLSRAMLDSVLDALLGALTVEQVLVIVPNGVLPTTRHDTRLRVVSEHIADPDWRESGGLNPALRQAQRAAERGGATGLLIVPADLPLIESADIDALVQVASRTCVIAPDRAGWGTNALLLTPPTAIEPSFGDDSFERHRRLADNAGLDLAVVERPGLALDLDTPSDIVRLLSSGRGGRAAHLLQALGIERRLAAEVPGQARSATI